eukprot:1551569-Prymnesium_polylepis.2
MARALLNLACARCSIRASTPTSTASSMARCSTAMSIADGRQYTAFSSSRTHALRRVDSCFLSASLDSSTSIGEDRWRGGGGGASMWRTGSVVQA